LLTGHESGKVVAWDVGRGAFRDVVATLPGPVTNLIMLPPTGFPGAKERRGLKVHSVTKPRYDSVGPEMGTGMSAVPGGYTINAQFVGEIGGSRDGRLGGMDLEEVLNYPGFPVTVLEEGLAELAAWHDKAHPSGNGAVDGGEEMAEMSVDATAGAAAEDGGDDFLTLDQPVPASVAADLEAQNRLLRQQVAALQRVQKVTFRQLREMRELRERKEMEERHVKERDAEKVEGMAAESLAGPSEERWRPTKGEGGVEEHVEDVSPGLEEDEENDEEEEESVDEDEMEEDTSDGG